MHAADKFVTQRRYSQFHSKHGDAYPDAVEDDISRARNVVVHVGAVQAVGVALVFIKHASTV